MPNYLVGPYIRLATTVVAFRSPSVRQHYRISFTALPEHDRIRYRSSQRLARQCLQTQARYWREVAQATTLGEVSEGVSLVGLELLRASLHKGRGAVLLVAHAGNPE